MPRLGQMTRLQFLNSDPNRPRIVGPIIEVNDDPINPAFYVVFVKKADGVTLLAHRDGLGYMELWEYIEELADREPW
jgi:hypothetical protein